MRTVSCLAAIGILLAVIGFRGVDGQDAKKRPPAPAAQDATRPAAKPAPGAAESKGAAKARKEDSKGDRNDRGGRNEKAPEEAETDVADKYADDRAAILKS